MMAASQRALFYSPLSFLRGREDELSDSVLSGLQRAEADGEVRRIGERARLWLRRLEWDSRYFGVPSYRLEFADWDAAVLDPAMALAQEILALRAELATHDGRYYLYADVPSEDVVLLQALGMAGLRLIETRLTLFHDRLQGFDGSGYRAARVATAADIPSLRAAAMQARNPYDRFHADPFFTEAVADEFLAEYAEQCVRGMADTVLVPAEGAHSAGAFVSGKLSETAPQGIKIGRLVLAAVAAARRGWYRDLNAALLCWMREAGMQYCVNTTQSTNRPVMHVCEQLGYRYGRTSHVLAGDHTNLLPGRNSR